jgi:hypothetical protein
MKGVLFTMALVLLAVPLSAQTSDPRWQPFLGCWELTADNVQRDEADPRDPARPLASRSRVSNGPRVCVSRSLDGGVRFETTLPGQPVLADTIVADGTPRPLVAEGCRGSQRAEFSSDGLRIFSRAELTCEGDPRPRQVSGISLLTTTGNWLDIRAATSGTDETVRVRRYYPADSQTRAIPRATLGGSNLSLDDIKEASAKVSPRALEAALVETNAGFFLSANDLMALDDSGVPGSVIDVMVALSYPDRFIIERSARGGGGGGTTFIDDPFMLGWAFGYPVMYDSFYYSPYYYSPFGYRPYDVYTGGGVVMTPVVTGPQPSGAARAVDGLGYTRIRPREVLPPDTSDTGSRTTSSGSMPSSPASSSSSGGSSGTASSGGGYSNGGGGGGGGDTGRTAQPR